MDQRVIGLLLRVVRAWSRTRSLILEAHALTFSWSVISAEEWLTMSSMTGMTSPWSSSDQARCEAMSPVLFLPE